MKKYKVVVFDIGGTLMEFKGMPLNWSEYYYEAFKKVSDTFQLNISDSQLSASAKIMKKYNPRINNRDYEISPEIIFENSLREWNCKINLDEIIDAFFSSMPLEMVLFEHSLSAIRTLRKQGVLVVLLTDLPCGFPDRLFKNMIASLFNEVDIYISSQSSGYRKPNTIPLEKIAVEYGFLHKDFLIVGDELKDFLTAKNFNCDFTYIEDFSIEKVIAYE